LHDDECLAGVVDEPGAGTLIFALPVAEKAVDDATPLFSEPGKPEAVAQRRTTCFHRPYETPSS
jgi:hypothetical protein